MTLTQELAKRINALRYEDLPPEAVHWAKVGILDTVGVDARRRARRNDAHCGSTTRGSSGPA